LNHIVLWKAKELWAALEICCEMDERRKWKNVNNEEG
jgi:hypothetical protein